MDLRDGQMDSQEDIQAMIKDISEGLMLLCPAPAGVDIERWVDQAIKEMNINSLPYGTAGETLYKSYVDWVCTLLDESN